MSKKKNVSINKRKKISKKVDKNSISTGNKKKYRFNVLLLLLMVIFIVWLSLLIFRYNKYKDINNKISKIDELQSEIKLINDNYNGIKDLVKKIENISNANNDVNNDIDKITKDIEDLDYKISKFGK